MKYFAAFRLTSFFVISMLPCTNRNSPPPYPVGGKIDEDFFAIHYENKTSP